MKLASRACARACARARARACARACARASQRREHVGHLMRRCAEFTPDSRDGRVLLALTFALVLAIVMLPAQAAMRALAVTAAGIAVAGEYGRLDPRRRDGPTIFSANDQVSSGKSLLEAAGMLLSLSLCGICCICILSVNIESALRQPFQSVRHGAWSMGRSHLGAL